MPAIVYPVCDLVGLSCGDALVGVVSSFVSALGAVVRHNLVFKVKP